MALWELSVLPDNTTKQHSPLAYRTHAVYDSLGIGCSLASLCVYMRKNGFQNNQNILFLLYAFVYLLKQPRKSRKNTSSDCPAQGSLDILLTLYGQVEIRSEVAQRASEIYSLITSVSL